MVDAQHQTRGQYVLERRAREASRAQYMGDQPGREPQDQQQHRIAATADCYSNQARVSAIKRRADRWVLPFASLARFKAFRTGYPGEAAPCHIYVFLCITTVSLASHPDTTHPSCRLSPCLSGRPSDAKLLTASLPSPNSGSLPAHSIAPAPRIKTCTPILVHALLLNSSQCERPSPCRHRALPQSTAAMPSCTRRARRAP